MQTGGHAAPPGFPMPKSNVGRLVGVLVGRFVGLVGDLVGAGDGLADGAEVGDRVGLALGDALGLSKRRPSTIDSKAIMDTAIIADDKARFMWCDPNLWWTRMLSSSITSSCYPQR